MNPHVAMDHGLGGAPRKAPGGNKVGDWKKARNGCGGEGALGVTSMASPKSTLGSNRTAMTEAVVFSIQFYGKTIGEVGLLDQDLSELDWTKFKSYIVSILLSDVMFLLSSSQSVVQLITPVSRWKDDTTYDPKQVEGRFI